MLKASCTDEHLRPSTARRTQKVRTYCTARPCSVWRACSCSIPLCSNLASAALTILVFKESRCLPGGPPTLSRSGRWCYPRLEGGRTLFGSSLPTYAKRINATTEGTLSSQSPRALAWVPLKGAHSRASTRIAYYTSHSSDAATRPKPSCQTKAQAPVQPQRRLRPEQGGLCPTRLCPSPPRE